MTSGSKAVFLNGKIRIKKDKWVEEGALACEGGKIIASGDKSQVVSLYGDWPKVDLKQKTVLAGFNDSHLHFYQLGADKTALDLSDVKDKRELKQKISAKINREQDSSIIKGVRLNDSRLAAKEMPDIDFLDSLSSNQPIIIQRICYHAAAVNSAALKLAGITKNTADPEGGKIGRFADGSPNGRLFDSAVDLVLTSLPEPSTSTVGQRLKKAGKELLKFGITSAGIDDLKALKDTRKMLSAYHLYQQKDFPKPRLYIQQRCKNQEDIAELTRISQRTSAGNLSFRYGPIKIMLDGSLGAKTAALSEPYLAEPNNKGDLLLSPEKLTAMLKKCYQEGFVPAIHAIGDRAIATALSCCQKSAPNLRKLAESQIVHCQLTTPELIERLGKAKIKLLVQPVFLKSDYQLLEDRLSPELISNSYAWRSLIDQGAKLAFSSDAPIEEVNPFAGIEAAITRTDWDYQPAEGFNPREKLTLEEALELYTKAGALISGEGEQKGWLTPGQLADFIVIEEDPRRLKAKYLTNIKVQSTYLAGTRAY